ncbi:hypothetical protein AAKU64_004545 [Undibacterium sp. GrIS 1.8]|uniref:hypothetical protein n=1 Tax=unclassified Undibacterium TaxID=2630295 RepID=UPI0033924FBD
MDDESPEAIRKMTQELAVNLFSLRDSLVELAMMCRDMQFEYDAIQRDKASVEVCRIFGRISATKENSPKSAGGG